MAVVSDTTIARAALAGGFPRDKVATAVAVALAESGGDATATNKNANGSTDHGVWQINSIHRADLASGDWRDPNANARMAYAVYRRAGNSFSPWYAWRDLNHLPFMARGHKAMEEATAGGAGVPEGIGNPLIPDAVEGLADEVGKAVSVITDRDFWVRVGMMAAGALILIAGLAWLILSTAKGKAKEIVSVVAPTGKVGKAAAAVGKAQ